MGEERVKSKEVRISTKKGQVSYKGVFHYTSVLSYMDLHRKSSDAFLFFSHPS